MADPKYGFRMSRLFWSQLAPLLSKAMGHRNRLMVGVVALAAVLAGGALAMAEEPADSDGPVASEQQREQPVLKTGSSAKGSSLAQAASKIRLQRPASGDGSGLVITNDNLQKVGSKGNLSVSGSSAAGTAPEPATSAAPDAGPGTAGAQNPANDMVRQFQEQQRAVDALEARLKNFDQQLAEPSRDPHYQSSHNSPHLRAGGVQDTAQTRRDQLAKELESEKKQLEALREQARRNGLELE